MRYSAHTVLVFISVHVSVQNRVTSLWLRAHVPVCSDKDAQLLFSFKASVNRALVVRTAVAHLFTKSNTGGFEPLTCHNRMNSNVLFTFFCYHDLIDQFYHPICHRYLMSKHARLLRH